jgi:dephospho-CoA kinase
VIGLAGGVGSGKSSVARILEELGAGIIESDRLGHEEINSRDSQSTLREWWGPSVFGPDGSVDRKKVASIVFADASQRQKLEAMLHPRIAVRRAAMLEEMQRDPNIKMVVIDSPLLFETGLNALCDKVVFVEADVDQRRARSEKGRNWPAGEHEKREKSQEALDTKRSRADYICENNSTPADLRNQVSQLFSQILSESDNI